MTKRTIIKHLKERFNEIPTPEGHAKTNKGITTYFFDKEDQGFIHVFLCEHGEPTEHVRPTWPGITFTRKNRRISLWFHESFCSISFNW